MTIPSIGYEARMVGFKKTADKNGDWVEVRLQIHPEDVPDELAKAPLRSHWMVGMAKVGDDGQPEPFIRPGEVIEVPTAKRKWDELPRSQRAGIICNDKNFLQQYGFDRNVNPTGLAAIWMRNQCGVTSRAELDKPDCPPEAIAAFKRIEQGYQELKGQMAEKR